MNYNYSPSQLDTAFPSRGFNPVWIQEVRSVPFCLSQYVKELVVVTVANI